jgi:hypothetical protein
MKPRSVTGKLDRRTMEERLRLERPYLQAPPVLTEHVMSNLPDFAPVQRDKVRDTQRLWRRIALATGTIAVTFAVWKGFAPGGGPETRNLPVATVVQQTPVGSVDLRIPNISAEQVEALTAKLDEPLEKELENVISDTRQAIQFVASNFLSEN